jgi:excisionase family DNA binding protein
MARKESFVERLLNVNEVAHALGITTRAVREKVAQRKIPFLRMGKLLKVPERQLVEFISALPQCSASEALSKQWSGNGEPSEVN